MSAAVVMALMALAPGLALGADAKGKRADGISGTGGTAEQSSGIQLKRFDPPYKAWHAKDGSMYFCGRWICVADIESAKAKSGDKDINLPSLIAPDPSLKYGPLTQQSDGPRSYCLLRFKGPSVRWIGGRGPDHGTVEVLIDDVLCETVDTYAAEAQTGQVLFARGGLDPDRVHQLRIVVRRERNPKSTGRMVRIEAFEAVALDPYLTDLNKRCSTEIKKLVAGEKEYLKPEQWKPVAYAARAPEKGVTLEGGLFKQAFDVNTGLLNEWWERKRGYEGDNIPMIGWEMPDKLPESSEGRMIGAAAHTLRWGEREDMRRIVNKVVGIVKARQRPDGYCMPWDETLFGGSAKAFDDEKRNYGRVHLTRGLVAAGMVGNRDALDVMRKFYDWLYASPYLPSMISKKDKPGASAHNCNNGHEGSLLAYFSPVGKPEDLVAVERYWVQDFLIEESIKREPLSLGMYPMQCPHCYVWLAYKAWLDHYRATGAEKYLHAAEGAWHIVKENYLHIGGSAAICEGGPVEPRAYRVENPASIKANIWGKPHTGETCGGVFWADINHRFLQFFPDQARYGDELEATIYNVILASQSRDPALKAVGGIRYHNWLVGRNDGPGKGNSCCECFASPFIAMLPQYLYSLADDGVYVNLYAPSSITTKQLTLKTTTDFPATGKVEIKVEGTGKLRLRIPGWVDAGVPVNVNGKTVATGKPGSYVTLDKPTGTVTFELPLNVRTELYTGFDQHREHDRYAVLYGPLLMAVTGANDLDIPARELPGRLKPVAGKPLHFSVDGVTGAEYLPYYELEQQPFTCFPTMR